MSTISGLGTTYNLPNYTGELLRLTPAETPLLSMSGTLNEEGEITESTVFEWQTESLAATVEQPNILEGANPNYQAYVRANVSNVVQIFQRGFQLSYSKIAARQRLAGIAQLGSGVVSIGARNPVTDEVAQQTSAHLADIARQIEHTFLRGVFNNPSDNTTARRSRGIITAIVEDGQTLFSHWGDPASITATASNDQVTWTGHGLAVDDVVVFTALTGGAPLATDTPYYVHTVVDANNFTLAETPGGAQIDITSNATAGTARRGLALTKKVVLDAVQKVYDLTGINQTAEPTIFVGATMKRALTKLFITDANYREQSREVGGVNLTVLETDFGRINIALNRFMRPHEVLFCHVGLVSPVYLLIPEKGFLFLEELAKTGAASNYQVYGEIGLKYGHPRYHAYIRYASPVAGA